MRNILIILGLLVSLIVQAQDKSVDELPAETSPAGAATEYLYLLDGSTDKHITLATMFGVMNDTADALRGELADTAAQLRSEISGGGAWSASGNYIYQTTLTDSVGVGTNSPDHNLDVQGHAFADTLRGNQVEVSDYSYIKDIAGSMYFYDGDVPAGVNLNTLRTGGGLFTDAYPGGTWATTDASDNWHFGGTTLSTYKVRVTGNLYASTGLLVPTSIGMYLGTSYLYEYAGTTNFIMFNIASQNRATLTSTGTTSGIFNCDYFKSYQSAPPTTASEGQFYYNTTANAMLVYDGANWDTLGTGSFTSDSVTASDSLYLVYLDGATNGTRFLVPTSTGAIDTGTLVNAAYGLVKDLKPLGIMLRDQKNGEILWNFPNGQSRYGIGGSGLEGITAIASKIEETLRYVYKELVHNRIQYGLILLLIAWCVRLEFKLRKR